MDVAQGAEFPQSVFIGTENRMKKGPKFVWKYDLVAVGAEHSYVYKKPG